MSTGRSKFDVLPQLNVEKKNYIFLNKLKSIFFTNSLKTKKKVVNTISLYQRYFVCSSLIYVKFAQTTVDGNFIIIIFKLLFDEKSTSHTS